MVHASGNELEDLGREVFTRMGLLCINPRTQAPLADLDPAGSYSPNENLELDYLIPYENTCLVGEITARGNSDKVKGKYARFRGQFNMVNRLSLNERLWSILGVPTEQLRAFRQVTQIKGFFISTRLQRFDVNLSSVGRVPGVGVKGSC